MSIALSGEDFLPLDEWLESDFPKGGFHIDENARTLEYWSANDLSGIPDRIEAAWDGWKVTWHRDNYEFQLKAAAGKLCFYNRSTPQLQAQLKDILLREYGCSPVETLLKIAEEGRDKGEEVTISEWALRDDRLEINLIDRQTIFMALGNEGENAS